jgi:hypothetical protein
VNKVFLREAKMDKQIQTIHEGAIVYAEISSIGDDLSVAFYGGDRHHIGAVALGVPRASLDHNNKAGSASASVLCVVGHKEDQLARTAALSLAAQFQCVCCVMVGIHVDAATAEDIGRLQQVFDLALVRVSDTIRAARQRNLTEQK